jgi:hypothetical protein
MHRKTRVTTIVAVTLLIVAMIPVAGFAAGGTFTDDDTSIFEADIEWLASVGVTLGCNPPTNDNFCPDDNVSRGQMAAFMRRFSTHLDVEGLADLVALKANSADVYTKTEVDTAVGGSSAVAYASSDVGETLTDSASTLLTLPIDAPADGVLIVAGMVNIVAGGGAAGASVGCWIGIDSTTSTRAHAVQDLSGTVHEWNDTRGFDVTAGSHTLSLSCLQENMSTPMASVQLRNLTAVFSANEL